jgi:DNA-binding transcriptional ArsR family regulator
MHNIDSTLEALADPTRRQVIDLLREHPRRAGDLAMAVGASNPAMSKHLRVLRTSGLVEEERDEHDSRVRLYRLRPEPFTDLQSWLEEVQGFWSGQLASFKGFTEQGHKRSSDEHSPGKD